MKRVLATSLILLFTWIASSAQDRVVLIPKPVSGSPYVVTDSDDLYGKAYRWFREGEATWGADSLKKLLNQAGVKLNKYDYYVLVANFTDQTSPIGLLHEGSEFLDTRMFGLKGASLHYIYMTMEDSAKSYVSVVASAKASPLETSVLEFVMLFPPYLSPGTLGAEAGANRVWIDVRTFDVPENFEKNSDLSFLVKKELQDEKALAQAVFDNTSRERWGFGIGTAITNVDDLDFFMENGKIIVRPKPNGDLATFGLVNYFFKPVDTKAPTLASSFHLLAGLRLARTIEPVIGLGMGVPVNVLELHLFGGASVEFANKLKSEYEGMIGQPLDKEVDPFELDIRVKARVGLEVRFP